ncbi:MAG: hypothetical protein IT442_08340 [Phycisphaeraceae bacterium]|nr:hypothetical protein [Phycisphaeraceae bacterium]
MTTANTQAIADRRQDKRLAGRAGLGFVQAVVIDAAQEPIAVLRQVELVNVSAGGLSFTTITPVPPGSRVMVSLADASTKLADARVTLEALSQDPAVGQPDSRVTHCRLIQGRMPARLIHGW